MSTKQEIEEIREVIEVIRAWAQDLPTERDGECVEILIAAAQELIKLKERIAEVESSGLVVDKKEHEDEITDHGIDFGQVLGWNAHYEAQILLLADKRPTVEEIFDEIEKYHRPIYGDFENMDLAKAIHALIEGGKK